MPTELESGISLHDPQFLLQADADRLFEALETLPWKRHALKMYGREIPMPRLYQWMGVTPCIYGETITPHEWTPGAREIQQRVYDATGFLFDSLNVNYYRPGGTDYIGWHIDKEDEGLWKYPIASVSLGAARCFQLMRIGADQPEPQLELTHGSLIVMPAGSQAVFKHRLKKATKRQGTDPRINLTFRMMVANTAAVDLAELARFA